MRHFTLTGTFFALAAALFFLWQQRFERVPEVPTWRLADFQKLALPASGVEWLGTEAAPSVRLTMDKAGSPVITRIDFPEMPPVAFLHIRLEMKSHDLQAGGKFWEDGRCIIEWHPAAGGPPDNDSTGSVRGDTPGATVSFVIRPAHSPARPVLRLEHLGRSGDFELTMFEATVLRETWVWKIGRWVLLAAVFAWTYAWVGFLGGKAGMRSMVSASVWLLMVVYFVVPGPWKNLRPLVAPFHFGPEVVLPANSALMAKPRAVPAASAAAESVGNIPIKGDLALRIKFQFFQFRTVLHALMLMAPAFLIALLAGWRPALWLGTLLAVATEGAEAAFGYGFDSGDVSDLFWDAVGIALGLLAARWVARWYLNRQENSR